MKLPSSGDIVNELQATLRSPAYAGRLNQIHANYPNLKSEGRYRDALLEQFNIGTFAIRHSLRAYAEADKIDMVITRPGMDRSGWLRVELKYQFAYDLAHRVGPTLAPLAPETPSRAQVYELRGGDFQRIALDCLGRPDGSEADRCDVFLLIVQDRHGARHDEADRTREQHGLRKKGQWRCQPLYERGVRLQFLHEQVSWESRHPNQASYAKEWIEPTWKMLKLIHALRPFNLHGAAHVMEADSGRFPLTSHIFTLEFTDVPVAFPEAGMEFVSSLGKVGSAP